MAQNTLGQGRELLRQSHHGLMRETRQHGVLEGVELLLQSRVDARVGVTKQIHPPGTDGI